MRDSLESRLNRVGGQVRGIKKMYLDGRDCQEIVQQVVAARQALSRVGKDLLTKEAVRCSRAGATQKEFDRILKTLFEVN